MEKFQLIYALAVAECKSFSNAAQKLYITQPTLSQQIQKLEQECGFTIFNRNSRPISLTTFGEDFLEQAKIIMNEYDKLDRIINAIRNQISVDIVIGIQMSGRSYVANGIVETMETFPEYNLHLTEAWGSDLWDKLKKGEIDIALIDVDNEDPELDVTPIRKEYVCAVINPRNPLAKRTNISIEDLANENLVFSSLRSSISTLILREFESRGIKPRVTMSLNSSETSTSIVANGFGVTFATDVRAEQYKAHDLSVLPIEPYITRIYSLVSLKNNQNKLKIRRVKQILGDILIKHSHSGENNAPDERSGGQ